MCQQSHLHQPQYSAMHYKGRAITYSTNDKELWQFSVSSHQTSRVCIRNYDHVTAPGSRHLPAKSLYYSADLLFGALAARDQYIMCIMFRLSHGLDRGDIRQEEADPTFFHSTSFNDPTTLNTPRSMQARTRCGGCNGGLRPATDK